MMITGNEALSGRYIRFEVSTVHTAKVMVDYAGSQKVSLLSAPLATVPLDFVLAGLLQPPGGVNEAHVREGLREVA